MHTRVLNSVWLDLPVDRILYSGLHFIFLASSDERARLVSRAYYTTVSTVPFIPVVLSTMNGIESFPSPPSGAYAAIFAQTRIFC